VRKCAGDAKNNSHKIKEYIRNQHATNINNNKCETSIARQIKYSDSNWKRQLHIRYKCFAKHQILL
jgi:hypothetical protein